jgi:hypothetical protein
MNMVMDTLKHALMITGFVFIMMLLIEYINVLTRGLWASGLRRKGWQQYVVATLLGSIPGCLGAFVVVTLYEHGIVSIGALVATMIATSGDEAYVMIALMPRTFVVLTGLLMVVAIASGILVDWSVRTSGRQVQGATRGYKIHRELCLCYPRGQIVEQWRECTLARGALAITLGLFTAAVLTGDVGPAGWNWIRITLLVTSVIGLFIVCTVPDHFLEEHLWQHVMKKHVPRIFMWTFGALLLIGLGNQYFDIAELVQANKLIVLMVAGLVGLIPESGPHLLFLTLYAKGITPFSVLLTSSIVQDGHGMLPVLAHSLKVFMVVKAINLVIGLVIGLVVLALGY